jgi:hypothetical protein
MPNEYRIVDNMANEAKVTALMTLGAGNFNAEEKHGVSFFCRKRRGAIELLAMDDA